MGPWNFQSYNIGMFFYECYNYKYNTRLSFVAFTEAAMINSALVKYDDLLNLPPR